MTRILRCLFGIDAIDRRWMALLITFSVAHACGIKGIGYLEQYPGWLGWALFALSPLTAVVVGVNLLAVAKARTQAEGDAAAQA